MSHPQRHSTDKAKLLNKIEALREQIRDAHERRAAPLTGEVILRLSRKLDRFLNAYMKSEAQELDADHRHRRAGDSA